MIPIKTNEEIKKMREGGRILAWTLDKLVESTKVGVKTRELDRLAEKLIRGKGAIPSFKGFNDFPASLCVNINEGVVHGLPSDYKIQRGDLVTFDLGVFYKGFHTDSAITFGIGVISPTDQRFLEVGKKALKEAINKARSGEQVGGISAIIERIVEARGYSVVRTLAGHGVGKNLHEEPQIPGFGLRDSGPFLKKGMVLAIEVICNQGSFEVRTENDGWTVRTTDGKKAGLFEHTVAVTKEEPLILTERVGVIA